MCVYARFDDHDPVDGRVGGPDGIVGGLNDPAVGPYVPVVNPDGLVGGPEGVVVFQDDPVVGQDVPFEDIDPCVVGQVTPVDGNDWRVEGHAGLLMLPRLPVLEKSLNPPKSLFFSSFFSKPVPAIILAKTRLPRL